MITKITFFLRNIAKMAVQAGVLPLAYKIMCILHPGEKKLYVFADAHSTSLPFSLEAMYRYVQKQGIEPVCHFHDYTHEGYFRSLWHAISFMKLYARAKYVFICDTFVPVSSGKKDGRTKVIQLCHFSGPFKKIGYATKDDIPTYYNNNVFQNYDLVSASSEIFVPILENAMRQPTGVVKALGVSRSDVFFSEEWVETCKEEFYERYPDAKGKKILLWSPTFRGKAAFPESLDNRPILALQKQLGEEWMILIKHHPHDDAVAKDADYRSNCGISTERLLPVTDLFITDYSTTVLDYLAFNKPFVLYAPDLDVYEATRGFFVDYRSITPNLVTEPDRLSDAVTKVYQNWVNGERQDIVLCKQKFTSACDGKSTARIMQHLYELDKIEKKEE